MDVLDLLQAFDVAHRSRKLLLRLVQFAVKVGNLAIDLFRFSKTFSSAFSLSKEVFKLVGVSILIAERKGVCGI